jgi:hypothetical protein
LLAIKKAEATLHRDRQLFQKEINIQSKTYHTQVIPNKKLFEIVTNQKILIEAFQRNDPFYQKKYFLKGKEEISL